MHYFACGADIETELQVRTNEEFYAIIEELRRRFGEIIREYEFMEYTKDYKFAYLPEMYRQNSKTRLIMHL